MVVYGLSYFLSKWVRLKRSTWTYASMQKKYKQVVLETISWLFDGIQRVTYVTPAV